MTRPRFPTVAALGLVLLAIYVAALVNEARHGAWRQTVDALVLLWLGHRLPDLVPAALDDVAEWTHHLRRRRR